MKMEKVALNNLQLDYSAGSHPKLVRGFLRNEVMDSYGLSLEVYGTTDPIMEWLNRHFKYQMHNGRSQQSLFSQSCGDYALMYLIDRAKGRSMQHFLNRFRRNDYVNNDHKVGQMMKRLIVDEVIWNKICKTPCHQDTRGSLGGAKHLL